ncbi:MAG TPA: hypothetical protein VK699_02955 [Terriglobales bacterium]|nr:hypothetical protein [Terriglobales bacterium]
MRKLAKQFKTVWICAFLFLGVPALSFAGGNACSTATAVIPDGRSLELDYVPPSSAVWYQFTATANHSYSVEVRDDLDPDNADFNVLFYAAPVSCSSPVTNTSYNDTHLTEPAAGPHATRFSFVATASGAYYVSAQNGSGTIGHYVTVTVAETTLYSNVYNAIASGPPFPGGSGFTMFYALSNTTSSNLSYTMTVYDSNGNQIAISGSTPTPLNAHSASFLNSSSGFLATNNYGTVILTHNGPPGAIQVEAGVIWVLDSTHTLLRDVPFAAIRQLR